jgi:hypothetical protein
MNAYSCRLSLIFHGCGHQQISFYHIIDGLKLAVVVKLLILTCYVCSFHDLKCPPTGARLAFSFKVAAMAGGVRRRRIGRWQHVGSWVLLQGSLLQGRGVDWTLQNRLRHANMASWDIHGGGMEMWGSALIYPFFWNGCFQGSSCAWF